MSYTFNGLQEMINELYNRLHGYPSFCRTSDGNLFFTHRYEEEVVAEIINRHFMAVYGFKPEIRVVEYEYDKDLGEDPDGCPMIITVVYNHTTVVLPTREECVKMFKSGKKFDKSKQTLEDGKDLFYYCEVKSLLLAA